MRSGLRPAARERRLLDESRRTRSMMWIMAIMVFLTVLAGAVGLGMIEARQSLARELAGRLTIQLVSADAAARDRDADAIARAVAAMPQVARVAPVDRAQLAELLKPWLGSAGLDADLPMPAMIDVDLKDGSDAAVRAVEASARRIAPAAHVDRHAQWLSPVSRFLGTMSLVALGMVVLMATATTTVVLLAARSGLDMHRDMIAVLHMLGSTDVQVARLFQRRIAFDTLAGGAIGAAAGIALVAFLQIQLAALGSEMLGGIALAPRDWIALAATPLVFAAMATVAARAAVLRALSRTL